VAFDRQSSFCLTGTQDTILYDAQDWKGVHRAIANLRQDLKSVTGRNGLLREML
jgi:hypothetical protein